MASSVCNRHSIQNPEGNGITGLQIIYLFSYIFWSNPSDTETASSVPPEASQSEDSFLTFHQRLFHQQIFFFAASHFLWLSCLFQQILVSFKSNVNEKGNWVFLTIRYQKQQACSFSQALRGPSSSAHTRTSEAESGRTEANDQETPHLCTSSLTPTTALFHTHAGRLESGSERLLPAAVLCGVYIISRYLCRFSPGTLDSSHKTRMLD